MKNQIFIPGSEWVYFKIYSGPKTADKILRDEIFKFIREMLGNNIIDKWFFIRYADPDFHLRIRLHLIEPRNFSHLFNLFYQIFIPIVHSGLVWNIQCDTYQREIGRYGANTISIVEDLFFIDSESIINLLHQLDYKDSEGYRWKISLMLVDSLISTVSPELLYRKDLLSIMSENYKKEFGFTYHQAKKQLADKYRAYRKDIEEVMSWKNESNHLTNIINTRQRDVYSITEKLIALEKSGELQVPLQVLLISIVHMTINRWFRSKNRLYELVIYDFLSRFYTSEIAKNVKGIKI